MTLRLVNRDRMVRRCPGCGGWVHRANPCWTCALITSERPDLVRALLDEASPGVPLCPCGGRLVEEGDGGPWVCDYCRTVYLEPPGPLEDDQ